MWTSEGNAQLKDWGDLATKSPTIRHHQMEQSDIFGLSIDEPVTLADEVFWIEVGNSRAEFDRWWIWKIFEAFVRYRKLATKNPHRRVNESFLPPAEQLTSTTRLSGLVTRRIGQMSEEQSVNQAQEQPRSPVLWTRAMPFSATQARIVEFSELLFSLLDEASFDFGVRNSNPSENALDAFAQLENIEFDAKDAGYPIPTHETINDTEKLLVELYRVTDLECVVSTLSKGGISIYFPGGLSILCQKSGTVFCYVTMGSRDERRTYTGTEGLPDDFILKALEELEGV